MNDGISDIIHAKVGGALVRIIHLEVECVHILPAIKAEAFAWDEDGIHVTGEIKNPVLWRLHL